METVTTDEWTEDPLFHPDARKVHMGALFIVYLSASSFLPPFPLHFLILRYEKVFPFCNDPKTLVNSKYQSKEPIYILHCLQQLIRPPRLPVPVNIHYA